MGALPAPAAGLSAELGLRTGRFWHHAGLAFSAAQREQLPDARSAELSALALSLSTCFGLLDAQGFELAPCAGLGALRVVATPHGFSGTTQDRWLFGPSLAARFTMDLWGPLHLALLGMGQAALPRQRFVYQLASEQADLHRTAIVMGQLVLSLEVRF